MHNDTVEVVPNYRHLAMLHNYLLENRRRLLSQYRLNQWLDESDPDMIEANVFGLALVSGIPEFQWIAAYDWNGMTGISGERVKSWPRYIKRVFGIELKMSEYSWIESSQWRGLDDSLDGAIARIRFVVDNALDLPDLWALVDVLQGRAPVPYNKTEARLYDLSKTI